MRTVKSIGIVLLWSLWPGLVGATCATFDVGAWSVAERGIFAHALTTAARERTAVQWLSSTMVEACAPTADIRSLTEESLRTKVQTVLTTQNAAALAAADAQVAASTEVRSNDLCASTLVDITSLIGTEKATIQADIDATTNVASAKVALTTMNTRYAAALGKVARCVLARTITQKD